MFTIFSIFSYFALHFFVLIIGLPDLLLVRAYTEETKTLVNLNEWIGEVFQDSPIVSQQLGVDDEMLGASLHEGQMNNVGMKRIDYPTNVSLDGGSVEKLTLQFKGENVVVQSLFVEVKSHSDTLSERQICWLSLLNKAGRVCKFVSSQKKKTSTTKK